MGSQNGIPSLTAKGPFCGLDGGCTIVPTLSSSLLPLSVPLPRCEKRESIEPFRLSCTLSMPIWDMGQALA